MSIGALQQEAVPVLGWQELALSGIFILIAGFTSLGLRLGMEKRIALAALRSVSQLLLLGLVLRWLFDASSPWIVLGIGLAMALYAGFEATRRTPWRISGMLPLTMLVMVASALSIAVYSTSGILEATPWYEPRLLIPILGMILGNSLNGISLGLDTVLSGFDRERDRVEALLALGVDSRRASRDVVRNAIRTGMVPILNSMIAAGLLSIPGMMTGQILGGAPPFQAALYQIFILFTIAGAVALGTLGVVLGTTRLLFDERQRLRLDRMRKARG